MGEMVMKMFDRDNYVSPCEGSKKAGILCLVCLVLLYVMSAFTFMNALYCFSDCVGSTVSGSADIALRDAMRSVPVFLSFGVTLGGLMVCQAFFRNESPEVLAKKAKKHAVITVAVGAFIILYTVAMRIAGRYLSLTEGAPSPFYPLDAVLYALLFIAGGVCVLLYFKKYAGSKPYNGPSRPLVRGKAGFFRNLFVTLWFLFGLYGFCGFFYSIFIVDFSHGYLPYTLASMFASLVTFLSFAVWELCYNALKPEKRGAAMPKISLVCLGVSVMSAVFYFVALKFNLDGPSNVGFGLLPVAFSASVNFATMISVFTPLIASVAGLLRSLSLKKRG